MAILSCDLSLPDYWKRHGLSHIAVNRNWKIETDENGNQVCKTYNDYSRWIERLSPHLKGKAISDLTFYDLQRAVTALRSQNPRGGYYSGSTLRGVYSILNDIFKYAQDHGHATNVLEYLVKRKRSMSPDMQAELDSLMDPLASDAVLIGRLRAAMEGRIYQTRSMRPEHQARLIRLLMDNIETDGRYCGLAIMLYAGLRPAECRALCWNDVLEFQDHPERHMLRLKDTRDPKGNLRGRMKTKNAYRKIPAHIELEEILRARLNFIKARTVRSGAESNYLNWPICCFENNLDQPCRDYQFANLASAVLDKLSLPQDELFAYMLDMLWERGKKKRKASGDDEDMHLSLYVLRRNFWTWLQSSTQLSELEKLYVMGHDMTRDGDDLRPAYNNQTTLWTICEKMDRHIISRRLHEKHLRSTLQSGRPILLENRGVVQLEVPPELLITGGKLKIRATTMEAGDKVLLESLSPVKQIGKLEVKSSVTECPPSSAAIVGVNCEMDNYIMLKRLSQRIKRESPRKNDGVGELKGGGAYD